jgi:hypothetical protein
MAAFPVFQYGRTGIPGTWYRGPTMRGGSTSTPPPPAASTALHAQSATVVTFDAKLRRVAASQGLVVVP